MNRSTAETPPDTIGAICGQIAGAHYGAESIPAEWRQRLMMSAEIVPIADSLPARVLVD